MKEKIMPFYLLILLLITLTLSLFGCDSAEPSLSTNYKSGVKELQLKLLPNAPPEKI
ncbi:hypothetical protein HYX12_04345, partial [Candidatus Woesearchaeota archaeon]|nr:hypothetical protein [Candidatus Woesearchaeota archaeon]